MLTNHCLIVNRQVNKRVLYQKIINNQHKKIFLVTFFERNFRTELKIRQHTITH
jgi:hypothetical protein